LERAENSGSEK